MRLSPPASLRSALLLVALSATTTPSLAHERPLTGLTLQSYTARDGLPSKLVSTLLLDGRGFLWMGTPEGLVRFDGLDFHTFDRRNSSAFQSHNVASLAEDGRGGLWVGTGGGGLYRLVDGQIESVLSATDLPHSEVIALHREESGKLWIGTRGGLCDLEGEVLSCFDESDGLPSSWIGGHEGAPAFQALATDAEGRLWVATTDGLAYREGQEFKAFPLPDDEHVVALQLDSEGQLWAGTGHGRIGTLSLASFEPRLELGSGIIVSTLLHDPSGSLWIGTTTQGLARWHDQRLEWLGSELGLVGDAVESMLLDPQGQIWVGTYSGLARLSDALFSQYGELHGLEGAFVVGLSAGAGGLWAVTSSGGLHQFDGEFFSTVLNANGLLPGQIRRVLETRDGQVWIGGHKGLFRLRGGHLEPVGESLRGQNINVLYEDSSGRLWVGRGQCGLHRFDGRTWQSWEDEDGFPEGGVFTVLEARSGEVWVGTRKGLVRLAEDELTVFDQDDGLPDPLVMALHEDEDGILWIGTVSHGLVRFDGERFATIGERQGLPDNTIWAILEDDLGYFWMSSNRGIARVDRADLMAVASGERDRVTAVRYGPYEGLMETDCIGGFLSAGIETPEGWMAFATSGGVAVVRHPTQASNHSDLPRAQFLAARIDGKAFALGESLVLAPGSNHVEVEVSAPTFVSPEQVLIRHRLVGFEATWHEIGRRRELVYTNLPPGQWILEVATSRDGVYWGEPARLPVDVAARWYQRGWARSGAVLAFLVLLWVAFRYRVARLRRRQALLEQRVEERTEELQQLVELTRIINQGVVLEEVLDLIWKSFRAAIPYDRVGFALVDESGEVLRSVWSRSDGGYPGIPVGYEANIAGSSLETVILRREARIINDLEAYLRDHPDSESTQRIIAAGLRSSFTCPLSAMGRIVGCLFFSSAEAGVYGPEHARFFDQIATTLSATIEKARLHHDLLEAKERLEEVSRTDFLTGLSNRRSMIEDAGRELLRSQRSDRPFSLILADVDHFKRVNDELGHEVGDRVLRGISRLLRTSIRQQDRIARWGGEEFLILLPETDRAGGYLLAEKLRAAVENAELGTMESPLRMTATFGVSEYHAGDSIAACIARADVALYEGKHAGRNRVVSAQEVLDPG